MKRSWNPGLWAGFVLVLLGVLTYPFFFARFAITRDFPWANLLMIALGLVLVARGALGAYRRPDQYRGKVSGAILAVLAVLVSGLFCYGVFSVTRRLPASDAAPQIGDMAPDFTLPDSSGTPVTLSVLIRSPFAPNGVSAAASGSAQTAATVLIFYRGYW
jgi:hypothetical protein